VRRSRPRQAYSARRRTHERPYTDPTPGVLRNKNRHHSRASSPQRGRHHETPRMLRRAERPLPATDWLTCWLPPRNLRRHSTPGQTVCAPSTSRRTPRCCSVPCRTSRRLTRRLRSAARRDNFCAGCRARRVSETRRLYGDMQRAAPGREKRPRSARLPQANSPRSRHAWSGPAWIGSETAWLPRQLETGHTGHAARMLAEIIVPTKLCRTAWPKPVNTRNPTGAAHGGRAATRP